MKAEFDHSEWSYFYKLDHQFCFLKLSTSRFIKSFSDKYKSEPSGDIQISILKCIIQKDGSLFKHELNQLLKASSKSKFSQKDIEAAIQELTINHYLTGATNIAMMDTKKEDFRDEQKVMSFKKRVQKQKMKQEQ